MKYSISFAVAAMTLATSLPSAVQAQEARPEFPDYGLGAAIGYEFGGISNQNYDGLLLQLRAIKTIKTYPVLFFGGDLEYVFLNVDTVGGGNTDGQNIRVGPTIGFVIPFDLFFELPENAPRGSGAPVYFRYNFLDYTDLDNGGDFENDSITLGIQLPLPFQYQVFGVNVFNTIQASYTHGFGGDDVPDEVGGDDFDRNAGSIMLQFGIPL